jgi:hypothetical protein
MTGVAAGSELHAELERVRERRVDELGADALAWLALAPVWTDRVARAAGFPERPLPLEELLARAEAVGWCVRRRIESHARTPALQLQLRAELVAADPGLEGAVLEGVAAVGDESLRAQILARLAAHADDKLAERVRSLAETVGDAAARADVLLALAAAGQLEPGAAELRQLIAGIDDPKQRALRLLRAVELLAAPEEAWLDEARELEDREELEPALAARLLKAVARWLPPVETARQVDRLQLLVPTVALGDLAVAAAWSGYADRARSMAASLTDERLRTRVQIELLVPLPAEPVVSVPPGDLLGMCRQVQRLIEADRRDDAAAAAERLLAAVDSVAPTPSNVGAVQQAAAAISAVLKTPQARGLLERSVTLATRTTDPAARTACLAGAVELARRSGRPDPVPEARLVAAAREIRDEEDRAWALARLARLVHPPERAALVEEALELGAMLDDAAASLTFWAPGDARERILDELRRRLDFTWVLERTVEIGERVERAGRELGVVPPALARWAELAAHAGAPGGARGAATVLDRRVGRLLEDGQAGQALTWLDTAALLSPLLLGDFETSVLANTRRVELLHRRELDRRRLADFLPRAGLLGAFAALLDQPPSGAWALHYLGVGGVGKTMLIRHLTADLAPARGVVTSRIDFDHLNPDFPRRRPAQLLLELITELEAHALGRRHMYLYRQAFEQLQEINAAARPDSPPVTLKSPAFAKAVRTFGGFLESLEAPVVLVLDTCEELEKLQPAGGRLEQLEATFALIEAVHEVAPNVRVVMAGRRPLARSGVGWRLDAASGSGALLPEHKDYLALCEIRGFDRAESEWFISKVKGLELEGELLTAILECSPDPGTAATLELPVGDGQEVDRYNPFDLDRYANWARADPDLTPAAVQAGEGDAYIDARIVGRLKHATVERLLPAVAALGRFDRDMLRPASDADEATFTDAWRELAATEWIDIQPDAALGTTFLEIDRGLRPRLEGHYRRPEHRGLFHEAARRLGPALARMVDERRLASLGVDHVAAPLRLLPPDEAARLVDRLAWKVVEEGAWGWASLVCERLLADHPGLGDSRHPAAAGLRAMLASAVLHLDPDRELGSLWESVGTAARAHPDAEVREWLLRRAILGARSGPVEAHIAAIGRVADQRHREVLVGALLSALHTLVDRHEAAGDGWWSWNPADLDTLVRSAPQGARAFARLLEARRHLLGARFSLAEGAFGEALALVTDQGAPLDPWVQTDWRPPDGLVERVWLEALRAPVPDDGWPVAGPPAIVADRVEAIERDRLASATLRRRLERKLVPAAELAEYEALPGLLEPRLPACQAHRAVPPFFLTIVRGWVALGEADAAMRLLRRGREAALAGRDPAVTRQVELATMETLRRLRLRENQSLRSRMLRSDDQDEREAAAAVVELVGPSEPAPAQLPSRMPGGFDRWRDQHPLQWEQAVRLRLRGRFGAVPGPVELHAELRRWSAGVGGRRLAELLLEEGELLALREPRRAAPLLDAAADLFESNRDPLGRLQTVVVAALTRARTGEPAEDPWSLRLETAYQELRSGRPDAWPEWSTLVGSLGAGPDAWHKLLPANASPWLLRLLAATAWSLRLPDLPRVLDAIAEAAGGPAELRIPAAPPAASAPAPALSGSSAGAPPLSGSGSRSAPGARPPPAPGAAPPSGAPPSPPRDQEPEAAVAPGTAEPHEPREQRQAARRQPQPSSPAPAPYGQSQQPHGYGQATGGAPPPPAARSRRRLWLFGLAVLVLAVVAIGLLQVAGDRSGGPPVGTTPPTSVTGPPTSGSGPPTSGPAATSPPVTSAPEGGLPGWVWVVLAAAALAVLAGRLLWRRSLAAKPAPEAPAPPLSVRIDRPAGEDGIVWTLNAADEVVFGSGRELGHEPYERQRAALPDELRRALTGRRAPSGAPLAVREVELLVSQELAAMPWEAPLLLAAGDLGIACWRAAGLATASLGAASPWPPPDAARAMLAPATWAQLVEERLGPIHLLDEPVAQEGAPEPQGLLLIMGSPVQTTAGSRLLVEDSGLSSSSTRTLIEPDALPYDRFGLVVVLCEPSESLVRVDAEREQASDLRSCAGELLTAGAAAVLCLPPMPAELAAKALGTLDARLRQKGERAWRQLAAAAAAIRGEIAAAGGTPEERAGATELALEVTVFVRP